MSKMIQMRHVPDELHRKLKARAAAEGLELTGERATQAMEDFSNLPISRYAHADLLPRIWQLRSSVTAYDAA
jgi:predicted nucleic acid-binding protein